MRKFRHIFFLRTYKYPSRRASMIYILCYIRSRACTHFLRYTSLSYAI